jgi:CBS-domain-containing membrane protein
VFDPLQLDGHRQISVGKVSRCRRADVRVEDFMTRRVVTITPETTLLAAAKLMLEHRVGGLPVLDASGRMIGVFSESDLLREEGEDGSPWLRMMVGPDGKPVEAPRLDARKVSDVMTRHLITIAQAHRSPKPAGCCISIASGDCRWSRATNWWV